MRVEGEHRRRRTRVERRLDDPPVTQMDAVERPDRDGARTALELLRCAGDVHVGSTVPSTATSSPS
jgi:hypothetical protein